MGAIFNPPLSTQRYCWVQEFISQDQSIKSVTDVGCAHGRMLIWLKHISNLELINCIDKSLHVLEDGIGASFQPNLYEMLFGRKNSEKQLDIRVYHGDIAVPDDRLKADCFTMVELIEHIPLDYLEKVCQTVFGYYRPRFLIVTTPNYEFNPLLRAYSAARKKKLEQETLQREQTTMFEQSKQEDTMLETQDDQVATNQNSFDNTQQPDNDSQSSIEEQTIKFRDHDHKFEWTREEFAQWVDLMCKTYSYDVYMSGVGELPGSEHVGPCTQIALFRRKETTQDAKICDAIADPTLCFDLFLNKLSVEEERPEFLGDPTLRKICLRAKYHIPGTPEVNNQISKYSSQWGDDEEMGSSNDWSYQPAEQVHSVK